MGREMAIFSILSLIIFSLTACSGGSSIITVGEIKPSENAITGEYHSFSGYYFKKVKLKEGDTLEVTFSAETEEGNLIAKVIDSEGETVKTLNPEDTVTLSHPGKYKFQVEGEKHKGNFTLSWNKK